MTPQHTPTRFDALGLPDFILRQIKRMGFTTPTPIQAQAIPVLMDGADVIGLAQTGTGKTLAFAAPMAASLRRGEMGLVLAPTRELAQQIEETFIELGVHSTLLVGGTPIRPQIAALKRYPDVVVATPGRLIDHLEQKTIDLRCVGILVLDEADRMLDIGFAPAIKRIVSETPEERQTMLFSATFGKEVASMANKYLYRPVRIEVERAGSSNKDVVHELVVIDQADKPRVLKKILRDFDGTVLVFTRTRIGARRLSRKLRDRGHSAAELHADRSLEERRAALDGFKSGRYRVLVATDIAARGIDVHEVGVVLNYDVPRSPEDYVHRTGRTGRAGNKGLAVTFATPDQGREVKAIEKFVQFELPVSDRSTSRLEQPMKKRGPRRRYRRASVA
ncbi:MAG TPA: DEAD/DEAH box helicase [Fimbriimonadaceae bacterium]|nr:DEAD/DEAH box helicase [Fimbriimonadaceae bacterium]